MNLNFTIKHCCSIEDKHCFPGLLLNTLYLFDEAYFLHWSNETSCCMSDFHWLHELVLPWKGFRYPSHEPFVSWLIVDYEHDVTTARFLFLFSHFCLCCRVGRYSLVHLRQNKSARYCTWRQRLRLYRSCFSNTSDGRLLLGRSSSRWFGVSGSGSLASSEVTVSGRPLTIDSTVHMRVDSPSSFRICCLVTADKTFLVVLICLSHTPPIWDAAGGLKIQSIPFWSRFAWIFFWFHRCSPSFSSRSAPTKFVPLSHRIISGWPLREMNLCKPSKKESVSILCNI